MISRYASLRQGLVGCWVPSLGASGFRLIDRSGYGNHGTLANMDPGTDWIPSGGKLALDFDGSNDYVALPSRVLPQNGFSVSLWVKVVSSASTYVIISAYNGFGSTNYFQLFQLGSTYTFRILQDDSNYIGRTGGVTSTNWTHICGTWDGQTLSGGIAISVNGVRVDTANSASGSFTAPFASSIASYIGCQFVSGSPNALTAGLIDDIRFYNRALTPQEIRLLYTGGRGVGLQPERIKHRRKTSAAATNRRRRIIIGASS